MTRKVVSFVVALALAVAMFAAPALAVTYGYVNTQGYVRMRSGPGDYPPVASVKGGTKLELLGSSGSWYHVRVLSTKAEGYIYKPYISKSEDNSGGKALLGFTGTTCTVKVNTAVVRKGARSSAGAVVKLKKNAEMVIAGSSGKYYKVMVISSGKKGYILKSAVKMGLSATLKATVYLRSKASTDAKVIRTISKGSKVVVYKVNATWSQVRYGSSEGYVHNAYIKP